MPRLATPRLTVLVVALALAGIPASIPSRALAAPAGALPRPVSPATARGISGQFIVYGEGAPAVAPGRIPKLDASDEKVPLKAEWLAIGAERVKSAVLRELGAPDRWRGRIHLYLRPHAELKDAPIRIVPVAFRDGWQYRVDVPDEVEWRRLVRALVEAVLLEMANRDGGQHAVQPPLWLAEGMSGIVTTLHGRDLVPQGQTAVVHSEQRANVAKEARAKLGGRTPLLFGELSFPETASLGDAAAWARYQGSATLLARELMRDDAGRAAMREMLARMPRVLNWQTAFLQANSGRFLSLLEVEKWWAVNGSYLLARDPAQAWPADMAASHLAALMREPAELPGPTNTPAIRRELPLATILVDWDFELQRPLLARKLAQLRQLYQVAPPGLVPLVWDYHQALASYQDARQGVSGDPLRRAELEPRGRVLARQAARRLTELDARLEQWRVAQARAAATPAAPAGKRRP